ncbi:MAG: S8 family serine peptidase [Patescibacteria group bacterium]
MKTAKYIAFALFFCLFLLLARPAHAFGETNRYLVKSSSGMARKAVGMIRHDFGNSFSADLTPFQVRVARMFGDVERAGVFVISASTPAQSRIIQSSSDEDGVIVAILDTGFGVEDDHGHGTSMAEIITSVGNVKLVSYKVCDKQGNCFSDDIAAAIRLATDAKARIINMSFGSEQPSPLIAGAIAYAADRDVLLVAAAGNNGPFADSIEYPARYPRVTAVGALSKNGTPAEWSSRGTIDAWETGEYKTIAGTSVAAAYFTARSAKLLAHD